MKNKTALVLGGGGLSGAYGAGVAAHLDMEFDAHYGTSVGVFATTFHLSRQKGTIENTWKNYVDGTKLYNKKNNPHKNGKYDLDLDYLIGIFRNHISHLNLGALFDENGLQKKKLVYAVTDVKTGLPIYVEPTRDNIFDYMEGSAALPFVNVPHLVDGRLIMDGSITDPLPIKKAHEDGYGHIVAVINEPKLADFWVDIFWYIAGWFYSAPIRKDMQSVRKRNREINNYISKHNKHIHIIRPTKKLPLKSGLDTDKNRIANTFEIGRKDAQDFMKKYKENFSL